MPNRAYRAGGINTADLGDVAGDAAIMQHFFGGGRGGAQNIDPMAGAMQLLGLIQKDRESGLAREEMEALNRYRMGGLEQSGQKTASEIELAKAQMQALKDEAVAKRAFEQAQLGGEQKRAEMAMVKELIGAHPDWPLEKVMPLLAGYSDPMKQLMLTGREEALAKLAGDKAALVHGVYGKPKELETLLGTLPPELLKRPEFDWQRWNEELAAQQGKTLTGGAGLAGLLWNAPGAAKNVTTGLANKLMNAAMGKYAPQVPYYEMTDPFAQAQGGPPGQSNLANYFTTFEGRPLMNDWEGSVHYQGRPEAPRPQVAYGVPQQAAAGPEWRYGTGTVGIPQEAIPVPAPMGMPSPGASLLSGGMGPGLGMAPGMFLEMLLRKTGLGEAAGAEEPFGMSMPTEEEIPPWQYGVGRMR
jgi:hypothetical protein